MDFYKLADGTLVGTKDDAKKSKQKWEPHAVPTDKQGLMDYLNGLAKPAGSPSARDSDVPAAEGLSASVGAPEASTGGKCPKCHLTPRGAALHAAGMKAEAIAGEIMKAEGYVLGNFALAVAERFTQLATRADKA